MNRKMKQNYSQNGITLISLVITIIIIVILAGVALNATLGEDGLIKKAQQARDLQKMQEGKEKLELELNDILMDAMLNKKTLTINELKERLDQLNWVSNIESSGTDSFNIVIGNNFVYEITSTQDGKFDITGQGKDNGEPWPTISLEQLPAQGNIDEKIQIKVIATVEETSVTKKVQKVINNTTGEENEYVSGGIIFEVVGNGTYEFEAIADNGKTRKAKITVNVENGETIQISAEPTTPRNTIKTEMQNDVETGPIKVNITFGNINLENDDKYQYRIGKDGIWQTTTQKNVQVDVTENVIVVAKYYDGKNSIGVQNYSIQNVDNVAPSGFTPTISKTTNSITVIASTEDTASEGASSTIAGIEKYKYSIDNGSKWQDSNIFSDLSSGSYTIKVKAIDYAGNETIGTVDTETENITGGTISIVPDVTTPRNTVKTEAQNGVETGPIKVTITYGTTNLTNTDRYQYKIGTGSWQTSSSNTVSFDVKENVTIASRYFDGKNAKDGTTYSIQNVDNVAPNTFTATATSTINSITLSGTTTDAITNGYTGDKTLIYEYSKDGSSWQTSSTITGLAQNTTYNAQIKAIDKAGNETVAKVSIKTKPQPVTGITLNKTTAEIVKGNTLTLTTTIAPSNANNKNVDWSSDNTTVATVSSDGKITAKAVGTAKITATAADGSGKKATCTVTVVYPTLASKAKAGDYVKYDGGNGYTGLWQVLYNDSTNGLQIISSNIVGKLKLGGTTDSAAKTSYNGMVDTLNTYCEKYINTSYAKSGRCVGSKPTSPKDAVTATLTLQFTYNGSKNSGCKVADTNYETDLAAMKKATSQNTAGIHDINAEYWVASRHTTPGTSGTGFVARMIDTSGSPSGWTLWICRPTGNATSVYYEESGIRPVITLDGTIRTNTGTGTSSQPYQLVAK